MPALREELRQNPRLRFGLILIACILLGYGLLLLHDQQAELQAQYQQHANKLQKLQKLTQQTQWQARADLATNQRLQLEQHLWIAESPGLAQADFQSWLDKAIKKAKIKRTNLKVDEAVTLPGKPKLWKVSARLNAFFKADALEQLLLDIAQHPQWIIVDQLDIPPARTLRLTLQVSAYFQAAK